MLFIDSEVVFSSSSDVGFDNGKVCWKIFSLCMSHDFLLKKAFIIIYEGLYDL